MIKLSLQRLATTVGVILLLWIIFAISEAPLEDSIFGKTENKEVEKND